MFSEAQNFRGSTFFNKTCGFIHIVLYIYFTLLCSWTSNELVVRQSLASKYVNMEAEKAMALEAITRWQLVKIQQTKKA
jgi:hypothetical protein